MFSIKVTWAKFVKSKCIYSRCISPALRKGTATRRRNHHSSYSAVKPATIADHKSESFKIPSGSDGQINIELFVSNTSTKTEKCILFLPSGPVENGCRHDDNIVSSLTKGNIRIIRIDYRIGKDFPFPVPVHDVLAGFDWIRSTIRPKYLGVCGQLFGGTLASMLALTEVSNGVVAAAINNPIVDWVQPDREDLISKGKLVDQEIKPKKRSREKLSPWIQFQDNAMLSPASILRLRSNIFANADSYHDPFASSIHWFRTSGIELPSSTNFNNLTSSNIDEPPKGPKLARKARKIFPPSNFAFALPQMRITTGRSSILQSQAAEIIDYLSASEMKNYLTPLNLTLKDASPEVDHIQSLVKEKFHVKYLPKTGLWGTDDNDNDDDDQSEKDLMNMIEWFDSVLPD